MSSSALGEGLPEGLALEGRPRGCVSSNPKVLTSEPAPVEAFRSLTGAGASARMEGRTVFVGNPALFTEQLRVRLDGADEQISAFQAGRLREAGVAAVLAHELSEILVIGNGLRMLKA